MLKENNITEEKKSIFHKTGGGGVFTSIYAKSGIQNFGKRAVAVMIK